jgi:hypothetical protein
MRITLKRRTSGSGCEPGVVGCRIRRRGNMINRADPDPSPPHPNRLRSVREARGCRRRRLGRGSASATEPWASGRAGPWCRRSAMRWRWPGRSAHRRGPVRRVGLPGAVAARGGLQAPDAHAHHVLRDRLHTGPERPVERRPVHAERPGHVRDRGGGVREELPGERHGRGGALPGPAAPAPPGPGRREPRPGALPNEGPFELGERAKEVEDELPAGRRGPPRRRR